MGTIVGWLGVIGTILGIFGFFISDLPGLMGGSQGLSEENIVATLAAMQSDKERAELQLTQIALADAQAANLLTQQWLGEQQATSQSILSTAQAAKDEFVATQNAISGMTATADALNATATQVALDAAATQAALAQITPTFTPMPTATAVPVAVTDYRTLFNADIRLVGGDRLKFSAQTLQSVPDNPPDGLAYVWFLDTDQNAETGQTIRDIGADARVAVKFDQDTWTGTARSLQQDGTFGQQFLLSDVSVSGPNVMAEIAQSEFELPAVLDWVIRVEIGEQTFDLWPLGEGHFTLLP
ncbi:MAG: hypothetical protein JXB30_10510 [Anaerolineae bacterium]|nr:hypothetical protein [Anaerolineae bacterium]